MSPSLDSPSLNSELLPFDLSRSNSSPMDEIQSKIYKFNDKKKSNFNVLVDLSSIIMNTDPRGTSNEKLIIQTDLLVQHLVEKLSDLLIKSPTIENLSSTSVQITKASKLLSELTVDIQEQKDLISRLLLDSFQSKPHIEVTTQVIDKNILRV